MKTEPYLFFNGNCEEALHFYKKALGAEIQCLMRYKETPPDVIKAMPALPENWGEKVMHANVLIGETQIMVCDSHEPTCDDKPLEFNGFSLSIVTADVAETNRVFAALAEDGKVIMPVGPAFWGSPAFGMCTDRFGLSWMVSAPEQKPA